ncbi:MAG: hypothetical protein VX614_03615 [Myxococcota bacterium]|nr:hypothetical protein [Myxococcota bacterium]
MRPSFTVLPLVFALVIGIASWVVSDRLESDNRFCVACHLDSATPLHEKKSLDLRSDPPRSLVAAHRASREDFRCIDCHRGTGSLGRIRVKLVAARDAASYLIGRFREPERMRHPLWDSDCLKCHTSVAGADAGAFHGVEVHNVEFPFACVECHTSHSGQGDPELQFLDQQEVLPICQECHEEY